MMRHALAILHCLPRPVPALLMPLCTTADDTLACRCAVLRGCTPLQLGRLAAFAALTAGGRPGATAAGRHFVMLTASPLLAALLVAAAQLRPQRFLLPGNALQLPQQ